MKSLVAVLVLCAGIAHAQKDTRSPLEAYRGDSTFGPTICEFKLKTALAQAEITRGGGTPVGEPADYRGCIQEQKAAIQKSYEAALATVKKPAARQALKEHYIAVLSQLNGLPPASDEIRIHYMKRQNDAKAKAEDMWTRFEVEN